ncbi:MAG: Cytochrome c peroxidase, partial [Mucilaginibacter sp.]|nr:Cytochrome c peroxidase [Mucilaginibacter sp.]
MRSTFKVISAGLLVITGCGLLSFHNRPDPASETVRQKLVLQADSFLTAVHRLQSIAARKGNKQILQQRFREARLA